MKGPPGRLWYLLPVLFGIIGGVGAYFILKDRDKETAKKMAIIGVASSVMFVSSELLLGISLVTQSSMSMEPTISAGDTMVIKTKESYDIGDIILFHSWREFPFLHRIVAKIVYYGEIKVDKSPDLEISDEKLEGMASEGKTVYITKGDHNQVCDQCIFPNPPVPKEDVIGSSIFVIPFVGTPSIWLSGLGIPTFLLPFLIIGAIYLITRYNERREKV